ncbi:MAG: DUF2391 family protein [Natronomonas sp.]
MTESDGESEDRITDIDAVLDDLEELERLVDGTDERRKVRETMRTARNVDQGVIGRFRSGFGLRDAGEATIGGFVLGMPLIVEEGTLEIGAYIAARPPFLIVTAAIGFLFVLGILRAARFQAVEEYHVLGVPVRLFGILTVASLLATVLMTMWGRVDWSDPLVAGGQTLIVAVVAAVGASIGDVLPE